MARRRRRKNGSEGIVGAGMAIPWALLLSWMFCPPLCILLIILLLALVGVKIYAFFKE